MSHKQYKWYFFNKNYGKIKILASNYHQFWNILEQEHHIDLKTLSVQTIYVSVRNLDDSSVPKSELQQIMNLSYYH